jgi:hypothetical protein
MNRMLMTGGFLVIAAIVACTTREYNSKPEATPAVEKSVSKQSANDQENFEFHQGVLSSHDKNAEEASAQLGLVSNTEREWSCASRQAVTICRGQNGAGKGQVLWFRYRGELVASSNPSTPIFARISAAGQVQSFAMRADSDSSYLLLTDGSAFCNTGGASDIYSGGAKSSCRQAPSQVRAFMKALQEKNTGDWKVDVSFGVSQQVSASAPTTVKVDKGTPPYSVSLPKNPPAESAE